MKTELVYCDLADCIYHENSKEEYHSTMAEPAPPICRLREIRLVGGQCCEYDEAERRADEHTEWIAKDMPTILEAEE